MKPGRNDRCPCGSGLKIKRCCGVAGAQRQQEAVAELFSLALHFPRYRPNSPSFDEWARAAPTEHTREALEAGINRLGEPERERIRHGFGRDHRKLWASLLRDFPDEQLAMDIVLAGSVVTGVDERLLPIAEGALELLQDEPEAGADPVTALALALEAGDLWSVVESAQAVADLDAADVEFGDAAVATVAERLATPWHDERLTVLLGRLRERLPVPAYPAASAALEVACEAVMHDERLRARLHADLLLESLPRMLGALPLAA